MQRGEAQRIGGSDAALLVAQGATGVVVLTLSRPRVHNALDLHLLSALSAAIDAATEDETVRAIVLTGTGTSFCSGDDLGGLKHSGIKEFGEVLDALQSLTLKLVDCPKPVVAALNGAAYGAGLELVLACDERLAVPSFVAATPETRLGLVATNGASVLLPRLIGTARAGQMLLDGTPRSAAWCLDAGLIDALVEPDALLPAAVRRAAGLAAGAPGAVAATRRMLTAPYREELCRALAHEKSACLEARSSPECDEGVRAFFDGRAPRWGA